MATKHNHIGFLISYDWLPLFDMLSTEEFAEVLLALIYRQKDGTPLPRFKSDLANAIAATIEPTIQRRLNGQKGGLKTQKNARKSSVSSGGDKGGSAFSVKHASEAI